LILSFGRAPQPIAELLIADKALRRDLSQTRCVRSGRVNE
jgi:hypothetical protein